jgi:hypothetical protein
MMNTSEICRLIWELHQQIVTEDYAAIAKISYGNPLTEHVQAAFAEYPGTFTMPPDDQPHSLINGAVLETEWDDGKRSFFVIGNTYTLEDGLTDLSLVLTFYELKTGEVTVEVTDIDVL